MSILQIRYFDTAALNLKFTLNGETFCRIGLSSIGFWVVLRITILGDIIRHPSSIKSDESKKLTLCVTDRRAFVRSYASLMVYILVAPLMKSIMQIVTSIINSISVVCFANTKYL